MSGPQQPYPPTGAHGGRQRHVFVLDSDPAFLEVVGDLLAEVHLRATLEPLRGDVAAVCERLRAALPNLVLVDVTPQRAEAEALLELMEADASLQTIGVLLASTNLGLASRLAQAHGSLVRDVLAKPFDLDEFYAQVCRLLG
jgi:DNA-binding NtrC family response regulator